MRDLDRFILSHSQRLRHEPKPSGLHPGLPQWARSRPAAAIARAEAD